MVKKVGNEKVGFVENLYPYEELKIFVHNLLCVVADPCLCYNYRNDKETVQLQKIIEEKGVEY